MLKTRIESGIASGMRIASACVRGRLLAGVALLVLGAGAARAGDLSGTVTNALTAAGIDGVVVVLDPPVGGGPIVTDVDGNYVASVPDGSYTVTFEDARFQPSSVPGVSVSGTPMDLDAVLTPIAPVIVTTILSGDPVPGATVSADAEIEILDGSTLLSVAWSQSQSVAVDIASPALATTDVTLPALAAYRDELIEVLRQPPIGPEQLPPNVSPPPGEFPGGLQDRFQVVGVNPFALEETGLVTLEAVVTTSSGSFTDTLAIHATLPFVPAGGIRNVPLGLPVLLHGKTPPPGDPALYDWVLSGPAGSNATLSEPTSQSPWFVPDVAGKYTLTVTDPTDDTPVTLEVWSGLWNGVITGLGPEGQPVADDCTFCHNDMIAPDQFTPWSGTGHAEIFSTLLDANGTAGYSQSCFSCHTIGYNPSVDNGGFDDAFDFADFAADPGLSTPGANWAAMVMDHPESARLANVQCESCHGPFRSDAHGRNTPSISLAADTCATCHGEPLRHARFQQWQLSGHANYELAIEEGTNGSCARCHTANGFLEWLPVLLDEDPNTDPLADITVTWTQDETHPQTCAACHDPHMPGTTSGNDTDARVRISGDTPPLIAGFTATDVGKGAICMTCHNTRRGLRNDESFAGLAGTAEMTRAPHPGAQSDVLMGQNAFFVAVGTRGKHAGAGLENTCVECHMQATPPPAALSYQQTGTNHTFYASRQICSQCHGTTLDADDVQIPVEEGLADLGDRIEGAILAVMAQQFALGRTVTVGGIALADSAEIADLQFLDSGGRQAIQVTLTAGGTAGPTGLNSVSVGAGGATVGPLWQFLDERIFKAGWNWALLEADGSRGVHNNAFATTILTASIEAVNAVPEPDSAASAGVALAALAGLASRARRRRARDTPG